MKGMSISDAEMLLVELTGAALLRVSRRLRNVACTCRCYCYRAPPLHM